MHFRFVAAATTALALAAPPATAQDAFEGVITYEMAAGGMSMDVGWTVKGDRMRQEMAGPMGEVVSLIDPASMVVTMIIPEQRMYMRIDTRRMMEQMGQPEQPEQPEPEDFVATGERETIAGHECERYEYTDEETTMELCIAAGLGFMPFAQPGGPGGPAAHGGIGDIDALRGRFGDGFVMLAMTVSHDGEVVTLRARSVERKSVPEELFQVPEGFTEMPMPGPGF